jgi:streptogramin lyase
VGPDGNLWWPAGPSIDRITPSGAVTEFPLPTNTSDTGAGLTVGPDGNLWWPAGSYIDRITPSGAVTEVPLPIGLPAVALTVGPDGNLWLALQDDLVPKPSIFSRIDRITPSGAVTEFPLPTNNIVPESLTVGPDGNLWFNAFNNITLPGGGLDRIGRITPSGAITLFPLPANTYATNDLTVGPDGNLWWPESNADARYVDSIGRITPSGAITEFPLPTTSDFAGALTVAPDGNLWFPDNLRAFGEINPTPPRVTEVVPVAHSRAGTTEIVLSFNQALDPGTAGKLGFYHLTAGEKTRHALVFSKGLKIARVFYDGSTHQVTLKMAKPHKGVVRVTVRPGIVAADGISSFNAFTAVIS